MDRSGRLARRNLELRDDLGSSRLPDAQLLSGGRGRGSYDGNARRFYRGKALDRHFLGECSTSCRRHCQRYDAPRSIVRGECSDVDQSGNSVIGSYRIPPPSVKGLARREHGRLRRTAQAVLSDLACFVVSSSRAARSEPINRAESARHLRSPATSITDGLMAFGWPWYWFRRSMVGEAALIARTVITIET
jgi:hypothetical protein